MRACQKTVDIVATLENLFKLVICANLPKRQTKARIDPHKGRGTLPNSRESHTFDVTGRDHDTLRMTDALRNNKEGAKALDDELNLRVKALSETITQDVTFARS